MGSIQGRNFDAIISQLSESLHATKNPFYFINTLIESIPLLSTIRVCLEAGILQFLVKAGGPVTVDEIVDIISTDNDKSATNNRHDFVVRMLRGVNAFGLVDEVSGFTYQSNDLTKVIANPAFAGGFNLVYDDNMGPKSTMMEMVDYHKANGWKGSMSGEDGPYQRARDVVGISSFNHWAEFNPIQASRLSALMQVMQRDRVHYFDWFPKEAIFGVPKKVYVDVGGGRGHDIRGLAKKYPGENVRFVLQDLPNVVAETELDFEKDGEARDARIELVAHDFFQPQPVKGADVYYLHKIIHDWPDSDCVRILGNIRDAMGKQSRILICDFVIPSKGCSLLQTAFDINMLSLVSGVERDEEMWRRLIEKVDGLTLLKIWLPPTGEGDAVVEVGKA